MAAAGAPAGAPAAGNGQGADAGGDAAQQGVHVNGNGDGQPEGGPDFAKLSAQLEALLGSQDELRKLLVSGGLEGGYGDAGAFDGDGEFGDLDLDGDSDQFASELMEQFDAVTREAMAPLAQALAATQNQFAEFQQESELKELIAEFPAIGESPEYFAQATHAWAQAAGLPATPQVMRLVYLAHQGLAAARAEMDREDPPPAALLEGGGGAAAAPRRRSAADLILNAKTKRGASVLDGI